MTGVANYLAVGEGSESLVFLHGVGGDSSLWQPQLEYFSRQYRAIAWDMPGSGASQALPEITFPALAEALCRLLDHLAIERAHLIGHSMGGMIAQEFAAGFPQRLRSLVLSATSPAFGKADGEWQQQFLAKR